MQQGKRFSNSLARTLFFLAIFMLLGLVFFYVPRLTIPIIFAYIANLICRPLFNLLSRIGVNAKISFLIIGILFSTLLVVPAIKLYPRLSDDLTKAKDYIPQLESITKHKLTYYRQELQSKYGFSVPETVTDQWIETTKIYARESLFDIPKMLTSFFEWLFLVPLFMYFMVAEGTNLKKAFSTIIPNRYFEKIYYIGHQFDKKIGSYIFAKFIEAHLVGLVIGIGLAFLNFPFALLLGFLAGLTNIIPYLGPILGFAPAIFVLVTSPQYSSFIGPVVLIYAIANVLDLFVIFPLLVSRIVNLHPLIVIISVVIGSHVWGVVGMIISVPLANVVQLILGEIYREIYPVRMKI